MNLSHIVASHKSGQLFKIDSIVVTLMVCGLYLLVSGCATTLSPPSKEPQLEIDTESEAIAHAKHRRDLELVASSLVGTLAQLDDFQPLSITIQATAAVGEFGEFVIQQLRSKGYGVQKVLDDRGRNYISYARTEIISDTGFNVEYSITIKDTIIARRFNEGESGIVPVSPVEIEGVEPQQLSASIDPFERIGRVEPSAAGVKFELSDGTKVSGTRKPDGFEAIGETPTDLGKLIEFNNAEAIKIGNYRTIRRVRVTLPSANNRILGERNKQTLRSLANELKPAQEILTLAGCFDGSSKADVNQHRSLAWQKRIREELLSAGVDKNNIRSVACPGTVTAARLPEQFVVVSLKRLNSEN